jgi:hypothetical protein
MDSQLDLMGWRVQLTPFSIVPWATCCFIPYFRERRRRQHQVGETPRKKSTIRVVNEDNLLEDCSKAAALWEEVCESLSMNIGSEKRHVDRAESMAKTVLCSVRNSTDVRTSIISATISSEGKRY